ncbi:hypothetical protein [Pseudalkalibacillus caeni]|uniref:Uncharacterized protein n=1 Tax=Exobacillus caeni TaxID=2574798 RepID=A0A5R9F676_9BACL|nr:hypothetical protein [Pseudalkalibacillus caeni]TLS37890.1 hypothetical protein FCL54_08715 [Pseudalkalibacillus caeni]
MKKIFTQNNIVIGVFVFIVIAGAIGIFTSGGTMSTSEYILTPNNPKVVSTAESQHSGPYNVLLEVHLTEENKVNIQAKANYTGENPAQFTYSEEMYDVKIIESKSNKTLEYYPSGGKEVNKPVEKDDVFEAPVKETDSLGKGEYQIEVDVFLGLGDELETWHYSIPVEVK